MTVKAVRLALAFPDESYVKPGAGDNLIARLRPYFRTLPIMLVLLDDEQERAYAPFQAEPFFVALDLNEIRLTEIDLSKPPVDDTDPPF